ncbi:28S ribosomal S2, mitochondrial [Paramuricea clavata]|uniref:Small ribosomal subunit protein uS2m n=1 Tax=Paramuricea clavata TaxID=317549 RepID=A0A7D9HU70_PARCT|nr:28S ribosomal S2, mitochondrial [Paramuricea clavata]
MEILKSSIFRFCKCQIWSGRARLVRGVPPHLNIQRLRGFAGVGQTRLLKDNQNEGHQNDPLQEPDFFQVSKLFSVRDLLNANIHLGHHEGCWNPFMKPYLYGSRERFHIIDLDKTATHLKLALNIMSHVAYRRGVILFVSTHPQFEELVQQTARDAGEYFVTRQWNIGTFTNSNILLDTTRLPDLVVLTNLTMFGRGAPPVKEAAQCNIPSVGVVDSDCDPRLITYPIPGNDDTPSAMELYCRLFKEAILNAKEYRESLNRT